MVPWSFPPPPPFPQPPHPPPPKERRGRNNPPTPRRNRADQEIGARLREAALVRITDPRPPERHALSAPVTVPTPDIGHSQDAQRVVALRRPQQRPLHTGDARPDDRPGAHATLVREHERNPGLR